MPFPFQLTVPLHHIGSPWTHCIQALPYIFHICCSLPPAPAFRHMGIRLPFLQLTRRVAAVLLHARAPSLCSRPGWFRQPGRWHRTLPSPLTVSVTPRGRRNPTTAAQAWLQLGRARQRPSPPLTAQPQARAPLLQPSREASGPASPKLRSVGFSSSPTERHPGCHR